MEVVLPEEVSALDKPDHEVAVAHYQRVAPLIAYAFGRIRLTSLFAPQGLDRPVARVGQLHEGLPAHVPTVDVAGAALHALRRACVEDAPEVFEALPDEPADRIRFSVASNAVGHGAGFPYALRVAAGLPMNLPIVWDELEIVARDAEDRAPQVRLRDAEGLHREMRRARAEAADRRGRRPALPPQPPRRRSTRAATGCAGATRTRRSRESRFGRRSHISPIRASVGRCAPVISPRRLSSCGFDPSV